MKTSRIINTLHIFKTTRLYLVERLADQRPLFKFPSDIHMM